MAGTRQLKPPKHSKRSSSFISKKKPRDPARRRRGTQKHMEIQYEADTVVFFPFLPRWRSVQTTEPHHIQSPAEASDESDCSSLLGSSPSFTSSQPFPPSVAIAIGGLRPCACFCCSLPLPVSPFLSHPSQPRPPARILEVKIAIHPLSLSLYPPFLDFSKLLRAPVPGCCRFSWSWLPRRLLPAAKPSKGAAKSAASDSHQTPNHNPPTLFSSSSSSCEK